MSEALVQRPQEQDTMSLIRMALIGEGTPTEKAALVKELVGLQQSAERFTWERENRQAKIDFDDALNACQARIGRIAPNQQRNDTRSWWADYAELDRTIRPIYTDAGFSISFSEVQPIAPGKVRIRAELSRGGISKEYFSEITPTTVGPKGNAMATPTDADAIALARAKRYLLLSIFNIAIGIDKVEKEGIPPNPMDEEEVRRGVEALNAAANLSDLKLVFKALWEKAKEKRDQMAKDGFTRAYEHRKRELLEAAK